MSLSSYTARRDGSLATSAEMILLFKDLEARHPAACAIRVVLDNARYNHSKGLKADHRNREQNPFQHVADRIRGVRVRRIRCLAHVFPLDPGHAFPDAPTRQR